MTVPRAASAAAATAALLALGLLAACATPGPPAPPGWKTERWQAGFGSWAQGGLGVAYDLHMPRDYAFQQKCGTAWIADAADGPEFAIRLSFAPNAIDRQRDFETYLKEDATRSSDAPIVFERKTAYAVGGQPFERENFTLGTARGFWLDGPSLSIIADLRDPRDAATDERIVASLRRVTGYGWSDLLSRRIPGLLGC
jgi:hypothetical protein